MVLWATDCAEHVLPYFEEKYPKDDRPRNAVEAGRAWARGEIATSEARSAAFAVHAAARDADQAAARAAARAAATAHVAGNAAHAANYAVTAASGPVVPTDSAAATAKERDRRYRRLPEHLPPGSVSRPRQKLRPCKRLPDGYRAELRSGCLIRRKPRAAAKGPFTFGIK